MVKNNNFTQPVVMVKRVFTTKKKKKKTTNIHILINIFGRAVSFSCIDQKKSLSKCLIIVNDSEGQAVAALSPKYNAVQTVLV